MLAIRPNSKSYEVQTVQTEAQMHKNPNDNEIDNDNNNNDENCGDDIPYHIRENAKPFTYGNLPKGFTTNELNHVDMENPREPRKLPLPPSPRTLRKRPSISPSRPVLHKTPTRKEFEELLLEKRGQLMEKPESSVKRIVHDAAIEKDLSELQQKLNKRLALERAHEKSQENVNDDNVMATSMEIIHLPDNNSYPDRNQKEDSASPIRKVETPTFPEILEERCVSPYPLVSNKLVTISTPSPPRKHSNNNNNANNNNNNDVQEYLSSISNAHEFHDVAPHLVKHAKDTSEFWYKPIMTRQEAVALLRNAEPGTFLIRNSTTYKNAYGLVLRVVQPPSGIILKDGSNNDELVRHFLLEPSTRGVRLKGCANEPLFTSLSAFVYEHSINPLALPCKLIIPEQDILYSSRDAELIAAQKTLSVQGAACNVLYLFSYNTESLTGDEAIRRTVYEIFGRRLESKPVEVHFKVTQQGITLTDNTRTRFFRRFYAANHISYCGLDPDKRFWSITLNDGEIERVYNKMIFAFVARPLTGSRDNECHVFCDLTESQPASAIVSFINKVIPINRSNDRLL